MTKQQGSNVFKPLSRIQLFLISGIFFLSCMISFGQEISLKFKHFGKQDGLNQSSVNFIFQDHEHYVWIANFGGINRFDGYEFVSYVSDFGDENSIPDNSVWTIYERRDHSLWFGTKAGLSHYNRKQDNFTNYFIKDQKSVEPSSTLAVKTLFEDKEGRFYVGSEGEGLFIFSPDEKVFNLVSLIPKDARVSAITEDALGNLWVGTENLGLFKISTDRSVGYRFMEIASLPSETIWSLYSDDIGNTWIGTDKDGLIQYSIDKKEFIYFKKNKSFYSYRAGDKIKTIAKGDQDLLWVGSATMGLSYYSYQENKFYKYSKNPYDDNSLFDNDVSSIHSGTNRVLYVGYYMKGFDKVIPTPFRTIKSDPTKNNTLSDNNVYCMYVDSDEILWMGTFGGGLNRYDPKTGHITTFRHDNKNSSTISHDWVRIIYEDKNKTMWVGTWGGGLNKFDRKTGSFKRYLPEQGKANALNLNIITALFEDADGELWIGTYGGGINIYQPETDDFRAVKHDKNDSESLSDDHITSFYQEREGVIWVCTYGGGLNAYDKNTNTFRRFLPDSKNKYSLNNHKTLHIFDEPNSDFFWITTLGGGINKYYYKENRFFHYTEKEGLSNNSTMGMLKDKKGTYWVSSNNGLSRFDPLKETFINYTTRDGLGSDDYNLEAYAITKDGTMYFGGKNGITYFNPEHIESKKEFPLMAFTKIKIEDSLYNATVKRIEIPYKDHITIEYAAINPDKTTNIDYAYQLIGQDSDWRNVDEVRHLEFANLAPGNYELRVKSTNANKIWNDQYASVFMYVPPPWYMTWYFRVGAVFVFVLAGYSYYRIKLSRAEARNKLLEQKVEDRTKTIQEKNRALGVEKEKTDRAYKQLKKLEGFKNDLTSMIVHDLKNPLVTILSYSSKDTTNKNLKSIHKSGNMMLDLIENMLEVQKFENTEVKLSLCRNSINTNVVEAINHIEVLANEKRIQIINTINPAHNVNIDKEVIQRVLINLLTNAIKFSSPDSKIEINEHINEVIPSEITIEVKDHGKGIPRHMLPVIFDKFSQAEAVDSGNIRSTGLGLTFCRMAIEAHGGKIRVTSKLDQGSSFLFTLPRLDDSALVKNEIIGIEGGEYTNPLYELEFKEEDFLLLEQHTPKISALSMYEMGEWMEIFEILEKNETETIKGWREMMVESLASFDENAFKYLKDLILNKGKVNTNE